MALSTRRRDRSYPSPITNFDDSNRESYIARSGGIGAFEPKPAARIVDYNLGKGGRDPSMIGGFGLGKMDPVIEVPTDNELDKRLDDLFRQFYQSPTQESLEPATSYLDPTADDYFLRELYNKYFNPVDPENEGLPMDEFQEYDPDNPNMFMVPEGQDLNDMDIKDIIEQMQQPKLPASSDDSYSMPNILQMLDDARDADDDSYDTLLEDLTLRYPNIFNI